jgi:hypothetical protein
MRAASRNVLHLPETSPRFETAIDLVGEVVVFRVFGARDGSAVVSGTVDVAVLRTGASVGVHVGDRVVVGLLIDIRFGIFDGARAGMTVSDGLGFLERTRWAKCR